MLIALETIANAFGRPFGLDFYFEQTYSLTDWRSFDWGIERHNQDTRTGKAVSHTLYAGPFQLGVSKSYRMA